MFFYGSLPDSTAFDIDPVPREQEDINYQTRLSWDSKAIEGLEQVPDFVRQIVVDTIEDAAKEEGFDRVDYVLFFKLLKQYAPPDVLERFLS